MTQDMEGKKSRHKIFEVSHRFMIEIFLNCANQRVTEFINT